MHGPDFKQNHMMNIIPMAFSVFVGYFVYRYIRYLNTEVIISTVIILKDKRFNAGEAEGKNFTILPVDIPGIVVRIDRVQKFVWGKQKSDDYKVVQLDYMSESFI